MKEIYYFIKTLKAVFGKKLLPVLGLVLFTLFLFLIFHNYSNADDTGYYLAPQFNVNSPGYISTNSSGDVFIMPTMVNSLYSPFSDNPGSVIIPSYLNDYEFLIIVAPYTRTQKSYICANVILYEKGTQLTINSSGYIYGTNLQYYKLVDYVNNYKFTAESFYNLLLSAEGNYTSASTGFSLRTGSFFSFGLQDLSPYFYISSSDVLLSGASYNNFNGSILFYSSYNDLLAPTMTFDDDTIGQYINNVKKSLTINMNGFSSYYTRGWLDFSYRLPGSEINNSQSMPIFIQTGSYIGDKNNVIISAGSLSLSGTTYIATIDYNQLWSTDIVNSFLDGTHLEFKYYVTTNPSEASYNDEAFTFSYTIGDEGSLSYIPTEGEIVGGGGDDSPSTPDYSQNLEDIDNTLQEGFDNLLDSNFTPDVGDFGQENTTSDYEGDYLSFINLFFDTMKSSFTYSLDDVETISLKLPFVKNGSAIVLSSDLLSSRLADTKAVGFIFYTMLQALYVWIFTRYVFIFCFNLIMKFKSGQFMNGDLSSNDTMINNML